MATIDNIWQFRGAQAVNLPIDLVQAAGGSELVARLLYQRGIQTVEAVQAFLDLDAYTPTPGWELPDMEKGVDRILKAIDANENILIFGDFDVDGITGTSILYQTLKHLNAKVTYYVPDREKEGHGLNTAALCRLVSARKLKLVISTDTGITNFAEVSLLNGLGVDTIITDHHELPENLPPSVANINPKLLEDQNHPLAVLCGAGVAYKICELLLEAKKEPPEIAESLLDLTAIGTIADLASLLAENRYLVYRGLQVLNRRERPGINKILEEAGTAPEKILTSETVGFTIGPRLNAIGRLSNATEAVELLTTGDLERARVLAAHLEYLNRQRQELCDKTFLEAERYLMASGGLDGRKAIALASPDWHLGVIGIVASRLIEKYHVPVFMMVVDESAGTARCSARSIPGFHLHQELSTLSHYFLNFGGHAGAGGFALKLESLEAFKRDLYNLTATRITEDQMRPIIQTDARLTWPQLNPHLVEMVSALAPFGMDNPSPLFMIEEIYVGAQRPLGAEGKHLKLVLTDRPSGNSGDPIEALLWNFTGNFAPRVGAKFIPREKYSFVVAPELNTWNNTTRLQLMVKDVKAAHKTAGKIEVSARTEPPIPSPQKIAVGVIPTSTTPSEGESPDAPSSHPPQSSHSPHWIDHRSRDSVESFIAQLMLPLTDGQNVLIFHEGSPPKIPFLDASLLAGRQEVKKADTVIFWDLPVDLPTLRHVVTSTEATTFHWVGGKYQTLSTAPSAGDFLKIVSQVLRKSLTEHPAAAVTLELDALAARLASSRACVTQALQLLDKTGLFQVRVSSNGSDTPQVDISLKPAGSAVSSQDLQQHLEFSALESALADISHFRKWLLTTPLETIKSSVILASYHPPAPGENKPVGLAPGL